MLRCSAAASGDPSAMHAVAMLACVGGAAVAALASAGVSDEQQTAWLLHAAKVRHILVAQRAPPAYACDRRWLFRAHLAVGSASATSAPGLGSPLPHLRRE